MSHDVEFHLALHCLQNYALRRGLFNAKFCTDLCENEPVHKMLVLIACVNTSGERSDELARPRSLFRAFVARIHIVRTLMMIQAKINTSRTTR